MGNIFSSGRSAAKRQAKAMERQMEQDRRQFEAQQAALEQEREQAAALHEQQMAEQRAKEQASKLQAQLAEDARVKAEDEITDVAPSVDLDNDDFFKRRGRRPLNLSAMLGL